LTTEEFQNQRQTDSFLAVNENVDKNEIPLTAENENDNGRSYSAEKQKRKSPENISVFFFFYALLASLSALLK